MLSRQAEHQAPRWSVIYHFYLKSGICVSLSRGEPRCGKVGTQQNPESCLHLFTRRPFPSRAEQTGRSSEGSASEFVLGWRLSHAPDWGKSEPRCSTRVSFTSSSAATGKRYHRRSLNAIISACEPPPLRALAQGPGASEGPSVNTRQRQSPDRGCMVSFPVNDTDDGKRSNNS